jgi:parallel beta-helix repeat protein
MGLGLAAALLALIPGAASAQPLACGQTITKDTTLHGDLGPCPGDGLVIGATNVKLDLNGHVIIGDNTGDGDVGVRNDAGYDGTVVENGRIRRFAKSIRLDGADQSRVSDVIDRARPTGTCCPPGGSVEVVHSYGSQIEDNVSFAAGSDRRALIVSGSYNSVVSNVAHGPGGTDIAAFLISGPHNTISDNDILELGGMWVLGSRNRITDNLIQGGELAAFYVQGAGNLIARNTTNTLEDGLAVSGPGTVIRKNVLGDRPDASVNQSLHLSNCRNARVEANVVQNGIVLYQCEDARVVNNSLPASGIMGIRVDRSSGTLIEDNTVSETEDSGIIVDGGSQNAIQRNVVSGTAGSGIFIGHHFYGGGSVDTVVKGNLVSRAGFGRFGVDPSQDGIHVDDPGTTIADNRANDNADYGIQAVPGVIDGGGNTASGNGNPLQCLNVVCN